MSLFSLDSGNIPRNVLMGKKRGFTSVNTVYKVHFVQKLMELINKGFWDKALGGEDNLGHKWKKLAKKTIEEKIRMASLGGGTPQQSGDYRWGIDYNAGVLGGKTYSRGTLTPLQRATWDRMYSQEFRKAQKIPGKTDAQARKIAEREAWGRFLASRGVKKAREDYDTIPINIRTGRLVAATAPGRAIYNRYIPPSPDQKVTFGEEDVEIDLTSIPYAQAVDEVRPIMPDDCDKYVFEAHSFALEFAEKEYKRILEGKKSQKEKDKIKEDKRIRKFLDSEDVPF